MTCLSLILPHHCFFPTSNSRSLPVKLSQLPCPATVFAMSQTDEPKPVVQQKKIFVPNSKGEKLAGVLHDVGSGKLAILCHGFRSNKEQVTLLNLADSLTREGINAFRFDFSGNGESEGLFQYGGYGKEVDDLREFVLYFSEAKQEVSTILGHSKGGNIVLLYASKYHDISTVVNISGRFDMTQGVEERLGKGFMEKIKDEGFIDVRNGKGNDTYRVTLESLMDRLNTDMLFASKSINATSRVLTVHGSEDEVIPVEDASEFDKLIPNHKLVIVKGANHGYTEHQSELALIVTDFVKGERS